MALELGVSQVAVRNEYYFVDLPDFVDKKRHRDAQRFLEEMHARVASNNRNIAEEDYKRYMADLLRASGVKKAEKFDRDAFERLRSVTASGGNRTR